MRSSLIFRAGAAMAAMALASSAMATQLDMTPGVTEISQEVFKLHRFMLWICVAIGVGVFSVMFYSILHHRKSKGVKPADFHESTVVEVVWTVIPFIILIVMAIPATRVLIQMSDTGDADLTVRVTGSQWKWHYEYLTYDDTKDVGLAFYSVLSTPREQYERHGKGFGSANTPDFKAHPNYLLEVDKPLVIPTGKKVRFLVTSDDVIHAWWVPDFALKRDAIPGFVNEIWTNVPAGKEGVYRGRCAELCGKDHAFMPIVVEAKSQAEFETWLKDAKVKAEEEAKAAANSADYKFADLAEANKLGEEVYNAKCAACHQAGGEGLPPMFPALKGSKMATDKTRLADHIHIVVAGKNAMPAWKGMLTPKEMAAVITYERNAWGNNTGDLVQPSDVAK
ncbi:MAG TPA: cytochrome c oxidase subunit II [Moraxellaceae bacterium]|nr:cytochrome c oxidase subunit II [Moraxellaceae bacterium]